MPVGRRTLGSFVLGVGLLGGATGAALAQLPYQAQPYLQPPYNGTPPYNPASNITRPSASGRGPAVPPSWNYDPYTDGSVATPQRGGD